MNPSLSRLGFDDFFAKQMEKLGGHLCPARVVGQHRRQWDVASGDGVRRAVLAGRLWADARVTQLDDAQPTVGDWVAVEDGDERTAPVIAHVLERRTSLARTSMARRGLRQTLVANVDLVAVVAAFAATDANDHVAKRSLHPRRIERYVAAIRQGGAEPLVLLNKADLDARAEHVRRSLQDRLDKTKVVAISCKSPGGLTAFVERLEVGTTVGLVGLSGVGKSSIVNELLGSSVQQVGEERKADARGRHTTTHRQLFVAPSGILVIDTPGMREFALSESEERSLSAFGDIAALARDCQFRDCTHRHEPGCRVREAIEQEKLNPDRLLNYQTLLVETARDKAKKRKPLTRRRQKYPTRRNQFPREDDD